MKMRLFFSIPDYPSSWSALVEIESRESVLPHDRIPLSGFQILLDHLLNQPTKCNLWLPTQFASRLSGITEQRLYFRRPVIARINSYDNFPFLVDTLFLYACARPLNSHSETFRSNINKLSNTVLLTGCNDVVAWLFLLKHEPLHFNVIAGVSPIAKRVHVPEIEATLQPHLDSRKRSCNLSSYKRLATLRRFMIKQYAVAGVHAVSLTIVDRDPVSEELGD